MARPSRGSLLALAAWLLARPAAAQGPLAGPGLGALLPPVRGVPVAVVNAVGFHNEVYTALLWALTQAGAEVTAYVATGAATFQIEDVIRPWYTKPFRGHQDFLGEACGYRLVVLATYPEHHLPLLEQAAARLCPGQRFALVVHNPRDVWGGKGEELPLFLARATNATLLALAPHTVSRLRGILQEERVRLPVHLFVPVFPVHTSRPGCTALDAPQDGGAQQERRRRLLAPSAAEGPGCSRQRRGFVIQGLFQKHRRNYDGLLDDMRKRPGLVEGSGVLLRMLGKGSTEIPPELRGRVERRSGLAYDEYYSLLQAAAAVVPAFASGLYLTDKASSSVAAAIVTGTPLLADGPLLGAYTYLDPNATFPVGPGEREADAMARVQALAPAQVEAVAREMGALRQRLYRANADVIGPLVADAGRAADEALPEDALD